MVPPSCGDWTLGENFLFRGLCILVVKWVVDIRALVFYCFVRCLLFDCLFELFTFESRRWWCLRLYRRENKCFVSTSIHEIKGLFSFVLIVLSKPRIVMILSLSCFVQVFFAFFMTPKVISYSNLLWLVLLQVFCNDYLRHFVNYFKWLVDFGVNALNSLFFNLSWLGGRVTVASHGSSRKSLLWHRPFRLIRWAASRCAATSLLLDQSKTSKWKSDFIYCRLSRHVIRGDRSLTSNKRFSNSGTLTLFQHVYHLLCQLMVYHWRRYFLRCLKYQSLNCLHPLKQVSLR